MIRKQFTFYESFYRAARHIRQKSARCDLYDAICAFALEGVEPDLTALPPQTVMAMELILPVLRTAAMKASGGKNFSPSLAGGPGKDARKIPGRYQEDTRKIPGRYQEDTSNKKENENKVDNEVENKTEIELEVQIEKETSAGGVCGAKQEEFSVFWEAYPRKAGREKALSVFLQTDVPLQVLLDALQVQKRSSQWCAHGGRFIPYPATWLAGRRWEDQLAPRDPVPKGSSGLGRMELAAIQRILREGEEECKKSTNM